MLTRVPDYYGNFVCLAGACPHTCCAGWEVVVDEESAARYRSTEGELGEKLRRCLQRDEDGDFCFPLDGERCPFLDDENLCEIHRKLGREATSITCREHPRMTEEYDTFREVTLSASCPAANALLLGSEEPLTFLQTGEEEPTEDEELELLVRLRDRMIAGLQRRSLPLRQRLTDFLAVAAEAQYIWEEGDGDALASLADGIADVADGGTPVLPESLELLRLPECLEADWPEILTQAEGAALQPQPEPLLERIAVYFAFHYLLKSINDGDLLSRAQLCVLGTLAVERLAGVLGLSEALRRFSCEVEHSEENLEALLEALRQEPVF